MSNIYLKEEQKAWIHEVSAGIEQKMAWVSEKNRDKIPYTTDENGDYDDRSDRSTDWNHDNGLNWWTNGFWGGMMWLLYQKTSEKKYAEIARAAEEKLETCFQEYYGLHHDVGFMYQLTAVADYRLTGRSDSRKAGLHAANLLAGRFNPRGGFIRAWNEVPNADVRGWAIIDCMFNISLLYWAARESGDSRFRHIAQIHADTVREHFIREDGSVCHIVEFDPETGKRVKSHGGQGYAEGSAWTRGQGWALYGFTNSYIHTGDKVYLETAKRVADYCISKIPSSYIVPIDFDQPKEPAYEDSCGACIIAGGLIELAENVPNEEQGIYLETAWGILKTIYEKRTDWSRDCDAIVQNCSAAYHDEKHHFPMNYADYFFIEAIYKLEGSGILLW